MKTFKHIDANSITEAATALSGGKASAIAGGTDLLCVLKDEILSKYPETIVNLKTIPGLAYIKEDGGILKIGGLTTLSKIAEDTIVLSKYPALAEAAVKVAAPQIRTVGTIGGNLCQESRCWFYRASKNYFYCLRKGGTLCFAVIGDNRFNGIIGGGGCFSVCPSDTAIALSALNATVVTNKRKMPIAELYQALRTTLAVDEIITEIQVPEPKAGTKQAFLKFSTRKTIDFAIVSVATAVTVSSGNVTDARIVLGGIATVPYRATDAENELKGKAISETTATAAGTAAVKTATITLSGNVYKKAIASALVKRALLQ